MRIELCWLLSFWGFASMALVCGLLAWPQLSAAWPSIEERIDRFRRQPPLAKVVLLVFIVGFIAYGSTKTNQVDQTSGTNIVEIVEGGTNDVGEIDFEGGTNAVEIVEGGETNAPPMMLMMEMPFFGDQPPSVTPEDMARGWQLWEVKTNCNISYAMPESAAFATNWWVRGAHEDVNQFDFGDWRFPFGSNGYSSVWALTWGKLRFALADTNTEIAAVGAPMSAVPHCSRLWSAADTNGSWLVTWENFALNRDTNTPVNAQVELRTTGDFITRSNEVETVYRRLDPEDWDGDGWRNDDDPDPYIWEEYWDNFWQYLPDGANTNVYYWVDIRPRWNSYIEFFGDGPSDLEDPCIWAKAGETYRVQLLIGKTYDVESDRPFEIVAKSDARVEVCEWDECSCTVVWPVTLTVAEGRAPTGRPRLGATWNDGGSTFHVLPDPPWLNGRIVWETYCCALQGDGTNFTFACDNNCTCEGCTASGNYIYAGYALPFWSWPCGCGHIDDQGDPGVAIDFDSRVIIYEDAYTNAPGDVVHPNRPNAVLRCEVSGGTYGGTLSVTLNGAAQQKLRKVWGDELPSNLAIAPGAGRIFVTEYEILEPSGTTNDICATAEFLEDFRNVTHSDNAPMTSVKVELEASHMALDNPNMNRHIFGVGEEAKLKCLPALSGICVSVSEGFFDEMLDGCATFTSPAEACSPIVTVEFGNVQKEIPIDVFEPEGYVVESINAGFQEMPGEAGLIDLLFTNRITPLYVSFYAVEIMEIPMVATNAIGYFAQPEFADALDHGKRGAYGQWSPVNDDNSTTDNASLNLCPKPWNGGGSFTWPIPNAWRVSGYLFATNVFTYTDQRFELEANGTARVSKFGWTGERETNDTHRVYGGIR